MPDLNDLLRWSIVNSTSGSNNPSSESHNVQNGDVDSNSGDTQQLSLKFNPTTTPSAGSSALHPSDPYGHPDLSPASTPGPATPVNGSSSLPTIPGKREPTASEILDLIMGRPDSAVMKEKMEFACDESQEVDQRVEALDDFEMLIELIDNANNMVVLKLWEPLLALLESPHEAIVAHVCWIAGTACQNNLQAQAAFFTHSAFPRILSLLSTTTSSPSPSSSTSPDRPTSTRSKAIYALSSSLKHWPLASSVLASTPTAYPTVAQLVNDPEGVIRRKAAFLVGTLVMQSGMGYEGELPTVVAEMLKERMELQTQKQGQGKGEGQETLVQGLKRSGVFGALLSSLEGQEAGGGEDIEFEENAMRALSRAVEKDGLEEGEKVKLRGVWEKWGEKGRAERGLVGEDGKDIARILKA